MTTHVARVDVIRALGGFESKTSFSVDVSDAWAAAGGDPEETNVFLNLATDWCASGMQQVTPYDVKMVTKKVTVYDWVQGVAVWRQRQGPNEGQWGALGAYPSTSGPRELAVAVDLVTAYGPILRQWWAFVPQTILEVDWSIKAEGVLVYNYIIETRPSTWVAWFPVRQVVSTISNRTVQPVALTHNKRRVGGTR